MPLLCNYLLVYRCNARCSYCDIPIKEENQKMKEQSLEDVQANLHDLKRLRVRVIDFAGGEPFLYRDLVPVLAAAKRLGFITTVTNNGTIYPKYARAAKGLIDALLFSLDSTDPEEHDRLRGLVSHAKTLDSIALAKSLGERVYVTHTVTDDNVDCVGEMVRFAQETKVVVQLNPCFSYFDNPGLSAEGGEELRRFFGEPYVIVDLAQLKLIEDGGNDPARTLCRAVTSTVVISPDNHLLLPCYHHNQQGLKIERNLYDLYRNSAAVNEAAAKQGRYSFCDGCMIYTYMRTSLFRRYPLLAARSALNYVRQRFRPQAIEA